MPCIGDHVEFVLQPKLVEMFVVPAIGSLQSIVHRNTYIAFGRILQRNRAPLSAALVAAAPATAVNDHEPGMPGFASGLWIGQIQTPLLIAFAIGKVRLELHTVGHLNLGLRLAALLPFLIESLRLRISAESQHHSHHCCYQTVQ